MHTQLLSKIERNGEMAIASNCIFIFLAVSLHTCNNFRFIAHLYTGLYTHTVLFLVFLLGQFSVQYTLSFLQCYLCMATVTVMKLLTHYVLIYWSSFMRRCDLRGTGGALGLLTTEYTSPDSCGGTSSVTSFSLFFLFFLPT